ncbi:MAG: hypothetical protein AAGF95_01520 [Chloroflexota bacterium]
MDMHHPYSLVRHCAVLILVSMFVPFLPMQYTSSRAQTSNTDVYLPLITTNNTPGSVEPTPVEELPPTTYVDLLGEYIDTGKWSLEEGLTQILSVITGEQPLATIPEVATVEIYDLTGLLMIVDGYLANTDETETRNEIERLYRLLAPDLTNIDQYSIPDVNGLNVSIADETANLDEICRTAWYRGFPQSGDPSECFSLSTVGSAPEIRVYTPVFIDKYQYGQHALDAANISSATYKEYGILDDVVITFSPIDRQALAHANRKQRNVDGTTRTYCMVTIHPPALEEPKLQFQQIVAHELFHCMQFATYGVYDQIISYKDPLSHLRAVGWWLEGTANYFSNEVYPTVDVEHRWLDDFHAASTQSSLIEMSYETTVFFQFLANEFGSQAIIELLPELLPYEAPTKQDQARVFAELDPQRFGFSLYTSMNDLFHDFGRAYLSRTILDTSGLLVPNGNFEALYTNEKTITQAPDAMNEAINEFTLERTRVTYTEKKRYDQQVSNNDVEVSFGLLASNETDILGWDGTPETVWSACPRDRIYVVLQTTATVDDSDATTFALTVDKDTERLCTCYADIDIGGPAPVSYSGMSIFYYGGDDQPGGELFKDRISFNEGRQSIGWLSLDNDMFRSEATGSFGVDGSVFTLPGSGSALWPQEGGTVVVTLEENNDEFIAGSFSGQLRYIDPQSDPAIFRPAPISGNFRAARSLFLVGGVFGIDTETCPWDEVVQADTAP